MGAWSHEPFGNDDALDWVYQLENVKDESVLARVFNRAIENQDDYLEADDGFVIVAAAEVVAKLLGKGTQQDGYTEQVDAWVKSVDFQPSADLLAKAQTALDLVLGEESELKELWSEAEEEDRDAWYSNIEALKKILK
ncbi:DUF4259 domain-containing protein [Acinetobacter sp. CFCC 10889]|uniref:DUF4259 domain-containing protein n=1 Tax=Acinetobacter sp. CFCC 10889 TaxID=1775557 RepID=UPI000DD0D797|nr:DUF4259 domain-containing protein [Acinetobacter sp. CFCC 10889]